jgi:hypothetical protein
LENPVPRLAFFAAVCFAALAIIGGGSVIMFEHRDHPHISYGLFLFLGAGIGLLASAFLAEKVGPSQKTFTAIRNGLLILFLIGILPIIALVLRGPG